MRLADAFRSASGLRDDALTNRFAVELLRRESPPLSQLDRTAVVAPLVRQAMQRRDVNSAFSWLEAGREGAEEAALRTLDVWRAEIFARTGRPDSAAEVYRGVIGRSPSPAQACLDAGETLADNGHVTQAREFFEEARDMAGRERLEWVERLAARFVSELEVRS